MEPPPTRRDLKASPPGVGKSQLPICPRRRPSGALPPARVRSATTEPSGFHPAGQCQGPQRHARLPDRTACVEHINADARALEAGGEPATSVDVKNLARVGVHNGWPDAVQVHDCGILEPGEAVRDGAHDIAADAGRGSRGMKQTRRLTVNRLGGGSGMSRIPAPYPAWHLADCRKILHFLCSLGLDSRLTGD